MKSKKEFLPILNTNIAIQLFSQSETYEYVAGFREENKAALLHANGIN